MQSIKDGINFAALFVSFISDNKIWLLFSIGLTLWLGYQAFVNRDTLLSQNLKTWRWAFLIALVVAIGSNFYFWIEHKAAFIEKKQNQPI